MLIDVEGYVKPASRESRLVMIQLEPRAEKITQREQETKPTEGRKDKKTKMKQKAQGLFNPSHGSMLRLGRAS